MSNQEDPFQLILDIEKGVLSFSEKFDEICSTVNSFEHGHNYQHSDLIKLEEGCKLCLKEWNQLLEKLLGIDLEEFQIVEKSKRENLVNQINSLLDQAKKLIPTTCKLELKREEEVAISSFRRAWKEGRGTAKRGQLEWGGVRGDGSCTALLRWDGAI